MMNKMMSGLLLLTILSLVWRESECQSLVLIPADPTKSVNIGQGLFLRCEASGLGQEEDPKLQWVSSQGQVITSMNTADPVYLERDAGPQVLKLFIASLKNEHAGAWICSGVLGGQNRSKNIVLEVFEDISFNGSKNQEGPIYNDHTIQCVVKGSPQPTVTWAFKGKAIASGGRYIFNKQGLKILNITKKDEGLYFCKARIESRGRFEVHQIKFVVMIPPQLTSPPKMNSGIKGKELVMYCRASGDPAPRYKWFKYEEGQGGAYIKLEDGGRYEISNVEGTMKIFKLKITDDGIYKCQATNPAGFVEGTARVDVLVPPEIIRADNGEGVENGEMTMVCVASGDPAPEMQWHKVGNLAPFGQADTTSTRVTIRPDKQPSRTTIELTITGLQASDISNYTCIARNEAGNDTRLAKLNVLFAPQFTNTPSDTAYAWTGSARRNITCIVDSNPHARITWKRNNQEITNNGTFTIIESQKERQVISNLSIMVDFTNQGWMFGVYVCSGTNNQGSRNKDITLKKAEHPSAPSVVDIARDSQRWLQVRIVRPVRDGGMPINGYRIQYSSPNDDRGEITIEKEIEKERIRDDEATPATVVDIDNLQPSTLYSFRVFSRTEVGLSDAKEIQFTTRQISEPEPIKVTSGKYSETTTEYRLIWDMPRDGGSPILHYVIRYRHVIVNETNGEILDFKGDFKTFKLEEPQATSLLLSNLVPNRTYQIEIVAVNGQGSSAKRYILMTTKNGPKPDEVGTGAGRRMAPSLTAANLAVVVLLSTTYVTACLTIPDQPAL